MQLSQFRAILAARDRQALLQWRESLEAEAGRVAGERRRLRTASFGQWWLDRERKGTRALFALVKRQETFTADPLIGAVPAPVGQRAETVLSDWSQAWGIGLATAEFTLPAAIPQDQVEVSCDDLRQAAKSFPKHTGMGDDQIQPRLLEVLPDDILQLFAELVKSRLAGDVGAAITILMVFIPKATGGFRPIGLFNALYRVAMRVRASAILAWEQSHANKSLFGGKGSAPADLVGGSLSIDMDAAKARGLDFAAVLLDVTKCYEYIGHQRLVERAVALEFPADVLGLAIRGYTAPRRVLLGDEVSVSVRATRSIVAGCTAATRLLRVFLIELVVEIEQGKWAITLRIWIDDLTVSGEGVVATLGQRVGGAASFICRWLVANGLLVSTKSVAISTSRVVGQEIEEGLAEWGVKCEPTVKMLGVDVTSRKARSVPAVKSRIRKFKIIHRRVARLKGTNTHRLFMACPFRGAIWGASAIGCPPSTVGMLRRAAARSIDGRSTTRNASMLLSLTCSAKADPIHAAVSLPIVGWAKLAYSGSVSLHQLQSALHWATRNGGARSWRQVNSMAHAFVASCCQIGWSIVNARILMDHQGGRLDLRDDSPKDVAARVAHAVEILRVKASDSYPCAEVGRAALKKLKWHPRAQACAKLVLTNALWSPAQAAKRMGGQVSNSCPLCGIAAGTWQHIAFECDATWTRRRQAAPAATLRAAGKGGVVSKGRLPQIPARYVHPPAANASFVWKVHPSAGYLSGHVFCDGSGFGGDDTSTRRVGFGIAMVSNDGVLLAQAFGPVAGVMQEVPLAELLAVLHTVERALPPLTVYSDCAYVVDSWKQGREYCVSQQGRFTRVWRQLFDLLAVFGEFKLVKVKAHATRTDIEKGKSSEWLRAGNGAADQAAKWGARLHPSNDKVAAGYRFVVDEMAKTLAWIGEASTIIARPQVGVGKARPLPSLERPRPKPKGVVAVAPICVPAIDREVGVSHRTFEAAFSDGDVVIICSRCGAYAGRRSVRLKGACVPTVATRRQRARVTDGKHPSGRKGTVLTKWTPMPATCLAQREADPPAITQGSLPVPWYWDQSGNDAAVEQFAAEGGIGKESLARAIAEAKVPEESVAEEGDGEERRIALPRLPRFASGGPGVDFTDWDRVGLAIPAKYDCRMPRLSELAGGCGEAGTGTQVPHPDGGSFMAVDYEDSSSSEGTSEPCITAVGAAAGNATCPCAVCSAGVRQLPPRFGAEDLARAYYAARGWSLSGGAGSGGVGGLGPSVPSGSPVHV